jgi:chromate transport protein ChrA
MVQNKKITTFSSALPVDNIYLSVALHIGVVGMLIFLALVWILWEEIRKKAETRNSYLSIAVASTFASFFLVGLFSIVTIFLAAMYLLFAISRSENQAT